MTSTQRCGAVDNPHIFLISRRSKDSNRCQLCNKHIRDVHIADHILDGGSPNGARVKDYQRRKLGI